MKKLHLLFLIPFLAMACKKGNLDSLAFPSQKLDSYEFEEYDQGEGAVPAEYAVLAANRTLVTMTSTDTATGEDYLIYGVYIGDLASINTDTVLLYCHGQSLHMDAYWARATLLASVTAQHNYGVFMMDYRGYGMSEGKPTEQGLYDDVDASINWLVANGAVESRTFYYGFSLGCIPVIERAANKTDFSPTKIIIESPLGSVENLAQSSLIINVDPNFVSSLEFDNAEQIKNVEEPMLWMHGVEDDYIAIPNGELIYENYSGEYKEAIRVEDAGHGDIPAIMGYENYLMRIRTFMEL